MSCPIRVGCAASPLLYSTVTYWTPRHTGLMAGNSAGMLLYCAGFVVAVYSTVSTFDTRNLRMVAKCASIILSMQLSVVEKREECGHIGPKTRVQGRTRHAASRNATVNA